VAQAVEPERFALAQLERLEVSQAAVVLITPNR